MSAEVSALPVQGPMITYAFHLSTTMQKRESMTHQEWREKMIQLFTLGLDQHFVDPFAKKER